MTLEEAREECERWFTYLDRQREKSIELQHIASAVRRKEITSEEGQRRVRMIDGSAPVVYDGANLEQAVRILLDSKNKENMLKQALDDAINSPKGVVPVSAEPFWDGKQGRVKICDTCGSQRPKDKVLFAEGFHVCDSCLDS